MEQRLREVLEREPRVAYALLFGSGARGQLTPHSDVDVAIEWTRAPGEAAPVGRLVGKLEEAAGRPVDLFTLDDDASIVVTWRVFREGKVIFCRDRGALVSRRARAIVDWLDFRPYHERFVAGALGAARGR